MGLFGNRDRDELKGRLDSVESELEKVRKDLERERAKADEARKGAKAARDGQEALKARLAEAEAARDRALESKARTDQAAKWLEDRYNQAMAAAGTAGKAREEDAAKAAEAVSESTRLRSENERLKAETERLRMDLDAARRDRSEERPRRPAPAPVQSAPMSEDTARLKAEVDDLHRRLAEVDERLRVALRKAEHNRRAYLITQMQLDLAEDRLHLITTGKPRPVFEETEAGNPERPVAEDVEGYAYADDDARGAREAAPELPEPAPTTEPEHAGAGERIAQQSLAGAGVASGPSTEPAPEAPGDDAERPA